MCSCSPSNLCLQWCFWCNMTLVHCIITQNQTMRLIHTGVWCRERVIPWCRICSSISRKGRNSSLRLAGNCTKLICLQMKMKPYYESTPTGGRCAIMPVLQLSKWFLSSVVLHRNRRHKPRLILHFSKEMVAYFWILLMFGTGQVSVANYL